jgi:hypothetical protein
MDALGTKRGDFAITEHVSHRTLAIPFFPNMTGAQVSRVHWKAISSPSPNRRMRGGGVTAADEFCAGR